MAAPNDPLTSRSPPAQLREAPNRRAECPARGRTGGRPWWPQRMGQSARYGVVGPVRIGPTRKASALLPSVPNSAAIGPSRPRPGTQQFFAIGVGPDQKRYLLSLLSAAAAPCLDDHCGASRNLPPPEPLTVHPFIAFVTWRTTLDPGPSHLPQKLAPPGTHPPRGKAVAIGTWHPPKLVGPAISDPVRAGAPARRDGHDDPCGPRRPAPAGRHPAWYPQLRGWLQVADRPASARAATRAGAGPRLVRRSISSNGGAPSAR